MSDHQYQLLYNTRIRSSWQATCACGWHGVWETTRTDALRHHTSHLAVVTGIYA